MLVRGKKKTAAAIGFFEVIIYVWALKSVVQNLDNVVNLLVYASGFAAGNVVGAIIEEKMAIGQLAVQVITKLEPIELSCSLRQEGFGVTVVEGAGKDGPRYICNVMLKRKEFQRLMNFVNKWDKSAFITASDARLTKGGFLDTNKK